MKAEFYVSKMRPKVQVAITRDSVCAGDDCDAPHEKTVEVFSFTDPVAFAKAVSSGYLPTVAGSGHSWTCLLNGTKIAEIRNEGFRALVAESTFEDLNRVHFTYHAASF